MSALASLCGRAEARALRTSRASARASRDEGALRFEIPLVHLRSAWSILDDGRGGRSSLGKTSELRKVDPFLCFRVT